MALPTRSSNSPTSKRKSPELDSSPPEKRQRTHDSLEEMTSQPDVEVSSQRSPGMKILDSMSPETRKALLDARARNIRDVLAAPNFAEDSGAEQLKRNDFCILYHDEAILKHIMEYDISDAVQWELARFAALFDQDISLTDRIADLLKQLRGPNVAARQFNRVVQGVLSNGVGDGPEIGAFLLEVQTSSAFALEGGPNDVFHALDWEDASSEAERLGINDSPTPIYGGQVVQRKNTYSDFKSSIWGHHAEPQGFMDLSESYVFPFPTQS
ncbi:uncharacterized protein EI90DRAFT_281890 [Cantharellus anzutake]|uniref:uncharacterized protein n=1 Tax=Cantharellus anzutake TaxID=1750568 RepID=UPI0019055251|nr:uncharacterized protein EI90DRAFT_281890 [Cantharellus anzutake]KAF8335960.1 hypothetical protein EI90DRAFT_281890 [Cantharellus anzutake]